MLKVKIWTLETQKELNEMRNAHKNWVDKGELEHICHALFKRKLTSEQRCQKSVRIEVAKQRERVN